MQAKDIPDAAVLEVLAANTTRWERFPASPYNGQRETVMPINAYGGAAWTYTWDLERLFPGVPYKVMQAKMKGLIKRGLADGCTCGCRGDYEITLSGWDVARPDTPADPQPHRPLDYKEIVSELLASRP